MNPTSKVIALLALGFFVGSLYGQSLSEPRRPSAAPASPQGEKMPVYGPYEAIAINRGIVRDVKVDDSMSVYLQLFPAHKDKELVVKISDERFAKYREWVHGGLTLVSPANSGKTPFGWTDLVQTKAKYIEYWMDGEIFLHLKRTDL